jgi:hypothetical protein
MFEIVNKLTEIEHPVVVRHEHKINHSEMINNILELGLHDFDSDKEFRKIINIIIFKNFSPRLINFHDI